MYLLQAIHLNNNQSFGGKKGVVLLCLILLCTGVSAKEQSTLSDIIGSSSELPLSSDLLPGFSLLAPDKMNAFSEEAQNEIAQAVGRRLSDQQSTLPIQNSLQDVLSASVAFEKAKDKTFLLDLARGGSANSAVTSNKKETGQPVDAVAKKARNGSAFLTLEEALSKARTKSPEVRAAEAGSKIANYNKYVTLGGYMAKLDYRYSSGNEKSVNALSTPETVYPQHTRGERSLVLRQPLLDFNIMAGYTRDLMSEEVARINQEVAADGVNLDVVTGYFDLVQALIGMSVASDYQQRLDKLMAYIGNRAKGGVISDVEVQRVQAASLGAERARFEAMSARDIAHVTLERMVGQLPDAIAFPIRSISGTPKDVESALPLFLARSPELKANRKQVDVAFYDQKAVEARYLPKLDLEVGVYDSKNPSGVAGKTQDKRAMLVFTANLLNGGTDYASVQTQIARREQLELQYESVYRKAVQRLRIYYLTLQGLEKQIKIAKKEYETYKSVVEDYDSQIEFVSKSVTDLLEVNNKYYQSRVNLMNLNIKKLQLIYTINYFIKEY